MFTLEEFLSKMHVEEIDTLLFSGDPLEMGLPRVFGGQVLGQALNAAVRTVDLERRPHSLHAYFLRPGDITRPIIYEVDPIRDGRSFSTRRVVAKQKGKAIFNASISFQIVEDGLSHQIDLPSHIPGPENILPDIEHVKKLGITHRTLLAFISDKALMSVGMMPHLWNRNTHRMIGASLDHAMWFHSEIRVNQWIYYHIDSPRSARARDLGRGSFYTQDGELIASTAQEGLIRIVEKDPS